MVNEYSILNYVSFALIKKTHNTYVELEFDMDLSISQPREFQGVKGTQKWKAFQKMYIQDKLDISVDEYVVVVGVSKKGEIHIVDSVYHIEYTVQSAVFTYDCYVQLSPESL